MTWRRIRIPTLLAALGVVAIATTRRTNADAETSLALYARALTAKQHGQWTRTRSLLKDAWAANPANLLPIVEMRSLFPETWQSPSFLDSLDRIAIGLGDATLGRCVRTMLADTFHVATALEFERGASPVTRRCGRLLRVFNGPGDSGLTLLDEYPGSHYLTGAYSAALARVDPARGLRWARQESRAENHPMLRVAALAVGGYALHKLGRHAEAADWERNAESLAKSWGTGASLLLLNTHRSHVTILGELSDGDSISVHAHAVANHAEAQLVEAVMHADPPGRAAYLWDYGVSLQATGRLDQSRAVFERLASIADTMDSESLEAYVRARLGRTLVKMGRLDAAERELQLSRALAQRAGATIALRESSHDLLHLHEGRGDFTAAIAAGNDFVRYADKAGTMATRMMGHHDLGWLYRRRGRIADAEKAFRAMIADVDTMGSHSYWAGEYSEYAGQVERAREYYRRALQDAQDRSRALSGLVRTSEALGDIEAAKRYGYIADRDTGSWYPEYSPMLPGLLARHGATDEARRQFRASRALAAGRGKTLGFAQLALESAELELQSGAVATARALADSAARAAALLGAGEVEVRARAISALAALRQDTGPRAALASLDSAVRRADAMRIAQLSAAMRLIEGDALRIAGRKTPAMRSYEVAASWVDSTASRIANDPSRASYRTTHIGVSNRALGMLVRNAGYPGRLSRQLEW